MAELRRPQGGHGQVSCESGHFPNDPAGSRAPQLRAVRDRPLQARVWGRGHRPGRSGSIPSAETKTAHGVPEHAYASETERSSCWSIGLSPNRAAFSRLASGEPPLMTTVTKSLADSACQRARSGISVLHGPQSGSTNVRSIGRPRARRASREIALPSWSGKLNSGAGDPRGSPAAGCVCIGAGSAMPRSVRWHLHGGGGSRSDAAPARGTSSARRVARVLRRRRRARRLPQRSSHPTRTWRCDLRSWGRRRR